MTRGIAAKKKKRESNITENGEDLRRNESKERTFPSGETVDEAWEWFR